MQTKEKLKQTSKKMDSPNFSFNVIAVAIFATVVFLLYLITNKSKGGKTKITAPKAPGSWPIIGHLRLLGAPNTPHEALAAIADKLGPMFYIQIGVHPTLVVSNTELTKELFTTHDIVVSNRFQTVASKTLCYNTAQFGFAPYGEYWRHLRKMVTLEILSNRRLELLKHVRISEVEDTVKELYQNWSKGAAVVELKTLFWNLTLNVILRTVAGKKYFGAKGVSDSKEAMTFQTAIRELFKYLGMFLVKDAVPWLGWLDIGGHQKAMKKTAENFDAILGQLLDEHKKKIGDKAKDEQDFMDVMISVMDGQGLGDYDCDTVIKATCLSMISAGTDTTMVTMTWVIAALLNNKYVLAKVKAELDTYVGKERQVQDADVNNLVYLQAVVKETMRLYPPMPVLAARQFSEDITIDGYEVPEGAWLMVNTWKIQRDPQVWGDDSQEFKPERFLTTNKNMDVRGQHVELFPFGIGRRVCPGISFSLQTLHLTLASFLHAFEISTPNDEPVDMTGSPGLSNLKATPLEVVISPRLPHHLYA